MEVQGKVIKKGETQTYGSNGFRKRELVVETGEQYPQKLLIEFVQDKTDLLDKVKPGDQVSVGINLRGREWTNPQGETKYFNSLQGWKIDGGSAVDNYERSKAERAGDDFVNGDFKSQKYEGPGDQNNLSEEEDDLPF